MENVNSLIRAENYSYSLKTRVITVKPVGSLAMHIVDGRKMYRGRREMLIILLEHQRAKKEAEVVAAVENCLHLLNERLELFFASNKKKIKIYARQIINKKEKIDNQEFFRQVLPEVKLNHLQIELKHEIQQEIQLLFGVRSLAVAGSTASIDKLVDHQRINVLLSEYRKAIFVAKHMTTVANIVWEQGLDTLNVSSVMAKIIKKFALGSMLINTVNCQPENQLMDCQREIEKYLIGVMMNIEHCIHQVMRKTVVKVFYELYEQTIASHYSERLALLETREDIIAGRRKYLLKQAYISVI